MEETGKAIILELANLGAVGKDIVNIVMKKHAPKKLILVGIEKSETLLGKALLAQARKHSFVIDESMLASLVDEVGNESLDLEERRQKGFYVDVATDDGTILTSPSRVVEKDSRIVLERATVLLAMGKLLCELFSGFKARGVPAAQIKEVRLPEYHGVSFDEETDR